MLFNGGFILYLYKVKFMNNLSQPKILFNLASRSRPTNLVRAIDNITLMCGHSNYTILVTLDVDDKSVNNLVFNDKLLSYGENVRHVYGFSKSKIDAINKNLWMISDWDILVNVSDDMLFTSIGFNYEIEEAMKKYFPDTDGFLHYHDGNQPRLATMNIIGRKWFDRTGYVYHPSYFTEWCDNEEQEKAKILKRYKYMGDNVRIMIHINPYHGHKDTMDDLYKRNSEKANLDKENFFKRLELNFGI